MKNKTLLFQTSFILFLLFTIVNFAKADLASSQDLYLERINNQQAAITGQVSRINAMSNLTTSGKTSLTNDLENYRDVNLEDLKTTINNCTTVSCVVDTINSDWNLPYLVLIGAVGNYSQGNNISLDLEDLYTLVNSTQAFITNHTAAMNQKDNDALAQSIKKLDIFANLIEKAQAATVSHWTCRQYDGDETGCKNQNNLKGDPCFFDTNTDKCLGDDTGSATGATFDNDSAKCDDWCVNDMGLQNCYQGNKCAANQLLEEFITESSGHWTCRQYDGDETGCKNQNNLNSDLCFFDTKTGKCLGDSKMGVAAAGFDKDFKGCGVWCDKAALNNCYQNNKCAANQLLEEFIIETVGECGPANNYTFPYDATGYTFSRYQCEDGTSSNSKFPAQGGTESWVCSAAGGDSSTCSTSRESAPVGSCGPANGYKFPYDTPGYTPTYYQCEDGASSNRSFPAQGETETWVCSTSSGSSSTCSASREQGPAGTCGTANGKNYDYNETGYGSDTQCSTGRTSNTNFPSPGEQVSWYCKAEGGNSPTCSATRVGGICGDGIVQESEECDDGDDCVASGDFCCADCTWQTFSSTSDFSDESDTLEGYKTNTTPENDSLDDYDTYLNDTLVNVGDVYGLAKTDSEKLADLNNYKNNLETLRNEVDTLSNDITTTVNNILNNY